jgi:hypothetical protein
MDRIVGSLVKIAPRSGLQLMVRIGLERIIVDHPGEYFIQAKAIPGGK